MTIINKGILMEYEKILSYLHVIDLSSNNFIGEIPNTIRSLTKLRMLNLSNNALTGSIPLSLANLTELESLDLLSNKLSGMIPPALAQTCGNPVEVPPTPPSDASTKELDWKIVLMGFGSGLVIGAVMGLHTTSKIEHRFLRFFMAWQRRRMHEIRFV
ncbi:receptor like protein 27-like [Eucalyptus grandis]|uniref:receptor like protein 27-like n=1 Tax=Eucalyptus grandis TaxID=71139 RepID=UPI00192EE1A9|nr:receptor like protein 27-like [Eucalyptus grandis]